MLRNEIKVNINIDKIGGPSALLSAYNVQLKLLVWYLIFILWTYKTEAWSMLEVKNNNKHRNGYGKPRIYNTAENKYASLRKNRKQ